MPRSLIVGTAGHIDHGKTALVRALTGIDTDRLIEEKRRGITIELGFAHLSLADVSFGIVDVPGHEKFIKSMVAGAGGIDLAILVVAADEGIMPQTREHLDICNLLGVRRGMVALTKADLVGEEWLTLVTDDLRQALEGSFLAGAPIVRCSAIDGSGLDLLKQTLLQLAEDLPQRDGDGALRLPLDRVFTIKGFGTVVTGTLLGGSIAAGDEVAVLPSGVTATVRRVQVHGQEAARAEAGQRTAVNLGGVDREEVARGEVIATPDTLAPSAIIDVRVKLLDGARQPLKARSRVLFHLGTRQQEASCVLLQSAGGNRLEPGGEALAQLRFERGVVALPGDRFILRGFVKQENYGTTVGGGEVLRVLAPKLRPRNHDAIALLARMADADEDTRLELEVLAAGALGIRRLDLQRRLPLTPRRLEQRLGRLREAGKLLRFDREHDGVIHRDCLAELRKQLLQIVDRFHREHPLREGIGKSEIHSRLRPPIDARLLFYLLQSVQREGELVLEQEICRRPSHRARIDASLGPLAARIAELYGDAGLGPPREAELGALLAPEKSPTIGAAVRRLLAEGTLVKVGPLLFHRRPLEALEAELQRFLGAEGEITPSQFKGLVGQSRKFSIPLAEHFDARGLTVRVGDVRRLR